MVYKEEKILIPMCMEAFTAKDWMEIKNGEADIGYALVKPGTEWNPTEEELAEEGEKHEVPLGMKKLPLDTGTLTLQQINLMLTHLPFDVSFVDENDKVRYYSEGPERIFPRSSGIIGRKVQNCHPPKSVHIVQEILDSFRSGKQDMAEFWLELDEKFLYIRYFALCESSGRYKGCLEVMQDATRVRSFEGERRLLQWGT
jgi:DUF438 domain-containing protein